MSPGRGRLLGAAVALALAVTASGGAAVAAGPSEGSGQVTRAALAECPPGPVWANTGGAVRQLLQYSPDGDVLSSALLARDYGDIAFGPDGSALYGVNFPGADMTTLYTIDTVTGAETASVPVTGPLDDLRVSEGSSAVNGLTARADGMLIAGSFVSEQIFLIDPATGVSSLYPASFPAGFVSAGDFLTLDDGDVLAFATAVGSAAGDPSAVFRIHPDNTVTQIGTVPQVFGGALSGGSVYGFGSNGDIYRLTDVPTEASTAPLPVTVVEATGNGFYGATAVQDAGECPEPSYTVEKSASSAGPVNPGDTLTYTVTVVNTSTVTVNADFTDDLAGVLDDGQVVPGSVTASTGTATLTGTSLNWSGVLAPEGTATVTYQVRVDDPATGDRVLRNTVTPTSEGGTCAADGRCAVEVPVADDCDKPHKPHKPHGNHKPHENQKPHGAHTPYTAFKPFKPLSGGLFAEKPLTVPGVPGLPARNR
ncbi:DUF11 domain-containing protein [Streptomyces sp. SID8356]|uniref:DUF7927 domain-containing protein n=1 Tax=unclassified Streptomyces TaxID=2593676 RepID=UPI0003A48EB1|nr:MULTISPECIES: DUF11 domain-containing protein [unclassified Streptomyces]MYT38935.1 DUF11 domain-containing protein [Streptomyces sp. SID8356]